MGDVHASSGLGGKSAVRFVLAGSRGDTAFELHFNPQLNLVTGLTGPQRGWLVEQLSGVLCGSPPREVRAMVEFDGDLLPPHELLVLSQAGSKTPLIALSDLAAALRALGEAGHDDLVSDARESQKGERTELLARYGASSTNLMQYESEAGELGERHALLAERRAHLLVAVGDEEVDVAPVVNALAEFNAALAIPTLDSPEAGKLADQIVAVEAQILTCPPITGDLAAHLEHAQGVVEAARADLAVALKRATRPVPKDAIARIGEVHDAVTEAEQQVSGLGGWRHRQRLETIRQSEQEELEALGFASHLEFLLGLSSEQAEPQEIERLRQAESALNEAISSLHAIESGAGSPGRRGDLENERTRLLHHAESLLGREVGDNALTLLRTHRPGNPELDLQRLILEEVLGSLNIPTAADPAHAAERWIAEVAESRNHRGQAEHDFAAVEQELAQIRGRLGELTELISDGRKSQSETDAEMGRLDAEIDAASGGSSAGNLAGDFEGMMSQAGPDEVESALRTVIQVREQLPGGIARPIIVDDIFTAMTGPSRIRATEVLWEVSSRTQVVIISDCDDVDRWISELNSQQCSIASLSIGRSLPVPPVKSAAVPGPGIPKDDFSYSADMAPPLVPVMSETGGDVHSPVPAPVRSEPVAPRSLLEGPLTGSSPAPTSKQGPSPELVSQPPQTAGAAPTSYAPPPTQAQPSYAPQGSPPPGYPAPQVYAPPGPAPQQGPPPAPLYQAPQPPASPPQQAYPGAPQQGYPPPQAYVPPGPAPQDGGPPPPQNYAPPGQMPVPGQAPSYRPVSAPQNYGAPPAQNYGAPPAQNYGAPPPQAYGGAEPPPGVTPHISENLGRPVAQKAVQPESRCKRHFYDPAAGVCQRCGDQFCPKCLVVVGSDKSAPPVCIDCALVMSGVRRKGGGGRRGR